MGDDDEDEEEEKMPTAFVTRFRICMIAFWEDPSFQWHMRLLLVHGGGGRWVVATPDLEVQYLDLSTVPGNAIYPVKGGEALPKLAARELLHL